MKLIFRSGKAKLGVGNRRPKKYLCTAIKNFSGESSGVRKVGHVICALTRLVGNSTSSSL